eukprot:GHVQ01028080.1.p1 GENE.GHVQ01028080.1~~GHVQ01028080.1.p1  ORF type:complete len:476 (-),score=64.28 GHVQ01028080.1:310-1737(-)
MHRLSVVLNHLEASSSPERPSIDCLVAPHSYNFSGSSLRWDPAQASILPPRTVSPSSWDMSSASPSHHPSSSLRSRGTALPSRISPDDAVICCAVRTPQTKSNKGGLKDLMPEELLRPLFETVVARTGINPVRIQDICIGNALQPGSGLMSSRMSQLLAGIPETCPLHTINRYCSSGLQAVASIAASIKAGYIDIGIAGGVESMTQYDMMGIVSPEKIAESVFENETARNCMLPMGVTSENVAEKYQVTRADQDQMAVESHNKASRAQDLGLFDDEIVPVQLISKDGNRVVVNKDDGIRRDVSLASLSKLKPVFKKDTGTTTAGNSSQVSDGASLSLIARRSVAESLGLPILGKFHSFVVVGVPPDIMGIGPAVAIPRVLDAAQLSMEDIDIFEINEAFASQACYCVRTLGVPRDKLNPKGGAIAIGHPLGSTGCRMIATLLPELRRTRGRYGVVSMCVGTGMGAAAVVESYGSQ